MNTVITILNDAVETSMPYNEFVLYRARHFKDERQVLIICNEKKKLPENEGYEAVSFYYTGKSLRRLRKTIKQVTGDCIRKGDRFVIHLHQVHSGVLTHFAIIGLGLRKKTMFTVHNTFPGYPFHNKVRSLFCSFHSHYITCVSNTAYDGYPSLIKQIKKDRMVPVQNGVDTMRIDSLLNGVRYSEDQNTVHFVYVARMAPVKNHIFLLGVIKKIETKSVKFSFIGSPNMEIVNKIEEMDLSDKIDVIGLIPRKEVFTRLSQADYYISPSVLEGLPVSVLEGLYCGLPALLSDIPQHKEIIGDSNISKVLPLEEDLWAKEIDEMASFTKEKVKEWGSCCKQYVQEHFSLERMHKDYSNIYNKLFEL